MIIDHGLCEGCGQKIEPKDIETYGAQFCHVITVDDGHGNPEPAPCGPVHRFIDVESLEQIGRVKYPDLADARTFEWTSPVGQGWWPVYRVMSK